MIASTSGPASASTMARFFASNGTWPMSIVLAQPNPSSRTTSKPSSVNTLTACPMPAGSKGASSAIRVAWNLLRPAAAAVVHSENAKPSHSASKSSMGFCTDMRSGRMCSMLIPMIYARGRACFMVVSEAFMPPRNASRYCATSSAVPTRGFGVITFTVCIPIPAHLPAFLSCFRMLHNSCSIVVLVDGMNSPKVSLKFNMFGWSQGGFSDSWIFAMAALCASLKFLFVEFNIDTGNPCCSSGMRNFFPDSPPV
mmetsp:Transcript_557/g.1773  ORF Transcript_557/g.1773 Transcript_557/m.1773 type:complete len:254 (-) Transcript_557:1302-2063(-)